jgi:hypothetical protein
LRLRERVCSTKLPTPAFVACAPAFRQGCARTPDTLQSAKYAPRAGSECNPTAQ